MTWSAAPCAAYQSRLLVHQEAAASGWRPSRQEAVFFRLPDLGDGNGSTRRNTACGRVDLSGSIRYARSWGKTAVSLSQDGTKGQSLSTEDHITRGAIGVELGTHTGDVGLPRL